MSEREEVVLCGASAYNKKFYLNQDFKGLPDSIKDDLKNTTDILREKDTHNL